MCLEYREVSDKISYFNDLICICYACSIQVQNVWAYIECVFSKGVSRWKWSRLFWGEELYLAMGGNTGSEMGKHPMHTKLLHMVPKFPRLKESRQYFYSKISIFLEEDFFTQIEASACLHYVSMHVYHEIAECMYDAWYIDTQYGFI